MDAGADADVDAPEGMVVTPPAPAALPRLTPCFDGFAESTFADGVSVCEPWPSREPESCAAHEAHFPGRPGCERIGTACTASGFPDGLPADGVHYVRAGATGGDGSLAAPFGSVSEAVAAAAAGDTVAIGVGTYAEEILVDRPMTLVGACAESTILTSSSVSLVAGVVTVDATDVTIENLQFGESERSAIWIEGAHSVVVRDVVIDGATMIGIDAERGADVEVSRVAIRDVARTTTAPVAGFFGRGINAESGAAIRVDSAFIRGSAEFGVLALHEGTRVEAERVAVVDTIGRADGTGGVGMMALDGGSLTARGAVILRAREFGIAMIAPGSTVEAEDLLVRETEPQAGTGVAGRAFGVQEDAAGSCARCFFERNHEATVFVNDGSGTFTDLIVASTRAEPGSTGRGLEISMGGDATAERVFVDEAIEVALIVGGAETHATVRDLTISDILPLPDTGQIGRGISVQSGALLELERAQIADVREHGILVADEAELVVSDLEIRRVSPALNDDFFGRGLAAQTGARVTGTRIDIEDTHDLGLALLAATDSTFTDLRVVTTRQAACVASGCTLLQGGHGVGVYRSTTRIDRLRIDIAEVCGVHVASDGDAVLQTGVVSGSAIGACVQSDDQVVAELQRDVAYVDNDLNLEATMLPVPEPVAIDD